MSKPERWEMAPDVLTVSARPEWRLRATIQANALVDALLAGACLAARRTVADILNLHAPAFAVVLGFAFAFASAFLFRIAVRDPVPTRYALVGASGNVFLTLALSLLVIFDPLALPMAGSRVLSAVAAVHACFGLLQFALLHYSAHTYTQPEAVAV